MAARSVPTDWRRGEEAQRRAGVRFGKPRFKLAPGQPHVSAQQNTSIQSGHRCHRFAIYGIYTRDLYKHHQE